MPKVRVYSLSVKGGYVYDDFAKCFAGTDNGITAEIGRYFKTKKKSGDKQSKEEAFLIDENPFCKESSEAEIEVSLRTYSMDEIQLYFSDMKIRAEERLGNEDDGVLRFEVFAPRMELRLEKEDIRGQRKIVAEFQRMLVQSDSRGDILPDEVCVGNFRDIGEAGKMIYLESLRGGERKDLVLTPVKSSSGRILKEKLDYLYEFFVDKQEFKQYVAALEAKVVDNCINYKCLQLFLGEIKSIENKIGG